MEATTLKLQVRELLRFGKDNARKGQEMAEALEFKNDRMIRLTIRELIAEGVPIISSVHAPYGYYIADSPEDITEHLGELRHRALEVLHRYKDLKIAARSILQPTQLKMEV